MKHLIVLAALLSLAAPVTAQNVDVIGSAIVKGKRIELLSDKTWRYVDATAEADACIVLNSILQTCGLQGTWSSIATSGTEFIRQYRKDSRTYAGILFEEVGAVDGATLEFMRNIVIENAAMGTGARPEDIPILDVTTLSVDDNPAERISYAANFNGVDFIFQNTIVNAPRHNIQLVVWNIGKELNAENRAANDSFVEAMRIDFPGN